MALRHTLLAFAGAFLLSTSPHAIAVAQDAADPGVEAPAPDGQDPALLLRRKRKAVQEQIQEPVQQVAPQGEGEPALPKRPRKPAQPAAAEQPEAPAEPVVPKKPRAPVKTEATDQPAEAPAEPVLPKKLRPPVKTEATDQPAEAPAEPVLPKKLRPPVKTEATDQPAEAPAEPVLPKKLRPPVKTEATDQPVESPAEPALPKKLRPPVKTEATDQPVEAPVEPTLPKKPRPPVKTEATDQPIETPAEPALPKKPRKPVVQPETAGQPEPPKVEGEPVAPTEPVLQPKPAKPVQPVEPAVEPQPQKPAGTDSGANPVEALIKDGRTANQLSDDELRARVLTVRRLLGNPSLAPDQRQALRQELLASQQEFRQRQGGQPRPAPAPTEDAAGQPAPAGSEGGLAILRDRRQPADLSDQELDARITALRTMLDNRTVPQAMAVGARKQLIASLQEQKSRAGRPQDQNPLPVVKPVPDAPPSVNPTPPLDQLTVDPGADQQARRLLADATPADRLQDAALRQRLETWRNALAAGNLSPETSKALRQRLQDDRLALRDRVAQQEEGDQPTTLRPRVRPGQQPDIAEDAGGPRLPRVVVVRPPTQADIPGILADRRRADELDEVQLNRRIQAYRDAAADERYSQAERDDYIRFLEADRADLRQRLGVERRRRLAVLERERGRSELRVQLNIGPRPGVRPQPTIFAAEEDDEVIEEQLVSRPLRPLPQRYSRELMREQPEAIIQQPSVRQAIPSVELDTIHFGFNEAFVREEEITNIDRIGRIIEKIVTAHPNEVFMIEGHTDAVGNDASNLVLSRKRADAVKAALIQYYAIQPDNLVTAGLGERYLKVTTPDPEQENRRVTLRRVTELLQN